MKDRPARSLLCAVVKVRSNPTLRAFRWQWRRGSPVPIPNTEVKPFSADGTWLETARESRSPPVSNTDMRNRRFAFCHSSVAQWQSTRLLTELLQVRVPPGEPRRSKVRSIQNRGFLAGFLGFSYRSLAPPFHEKSAIFHGWARGVFAFRSGGVVLLLYTVTKTAADCA